MQILRTEGQLANNSPNKFLASKAFYLQYIKKDLCSTSASILKNSNDTRTSLHSSPDFPYLEVIPYLVLSGVNNKPTATEFAIQFTIHPVRHEI